MSVPLLSKGDTRINKKQRFLIVTLNIITSIENVFFFKNLVGIYVLLRIDSGDWFVKIVQVKFEKSDDGSSPVGNRVDMQSFCGLQSFCCNQNGSRSCIIFDIQHNMSVPLFLHLYNKIWTDRLFFFESYMVTDRKA